MSPRTGFVALVLSLMISTSLPASALEITYNGEFVINEISQDVGKIKHHAIPVTRYLSVVEKVFPLTDAVDASGHQHCWYMIDTKAGLKAMIASNPQDPSSSLAKQRPEDLERWRGFIVEVYEEAEKSGGIEHLSRQCAKS